MDIKLDSLIARIKKDGLDEAQKISKDMVAKAQAEADTIIEKAEREAENIVSQGKAQASKLKANTEDALKQAARDFLLSLKNEVNGLLAGLLKQKVAGELKPEFMAKLIVKIVENWTKDKEVALEVLVSEQDKRKLESLLDEELRAKAKGKIEIKINKNINRGFRIGIKGQDLYYDFTDETIGEALRSFLNPAIGAMLDTK
ncbi:MAG: DivIVA domain-containing protein [Candidatus Omnitrophica bacterium]|nr:DivIVA domain-containing protein [Candidatus Omnitrophota bacterium]